MPVELCSLVFVLSGDGWFLPLEQESEFSKIKKGNSEGGTRVGSL